MKVIKDIKKWAAGFFTESPMPTSLEGIEVSATNRVEHLAETVKATDGSNEIEAELRTILLCKQIRAHAMVERLLQAFQPQITALPAFLKALAAGGMTKEPRDMALARFLTADTHASAGDAALELAEAICNGGQPHPLDPEIAAIRAETKRVQAEISKLRDTTWRLEELNRQRECLARERKEYEARPVEIKRSVAGLVRKAQTEDGAAMIKLAQNGLVAALGGQDKLFALLRGVAADISITTLSRVLDGSPESLAAVVQQVQVMSEDNLTSDAEVAAVLNMVADETPLAHHQRFGLVAVNGVPRLAGMWWLTLQEQESAVTGEGKAGQ